MITASIARRRARMLAALFAVAIGATILSGLAAIHYDIPRQMGQEFRAYGANLILVPGGEESALSAEQAKKAVDLMPADAVAGIAPYWYEKIKINEQPFMAAGTDLDEAKKASPYWLVSGEWPASGGSVLIGKEIADLIRLKIGESLEMSGADANGKSFSHDFVVSGIVQTGGKEEAFVFLPLEDLESLLGESGKFDFVECSLAASIGKHRKTRQRGSGRSGSAPCEARHTIRGSRFGEDASIGLYCLSRCAASHHDLCRRHYDGVRCGTPQ
jgi:putative ABC transport system permease protein